MLISGNFNLKLLNPYIMKCADFVSNFQSINNVKYEPTPTTNCLIYFGYLEQSDLESQGKLCKCVHKFDL